MNKAVFLDRDGTINKEVNYLYRKEDFIFIPKTIEAIKIFHELGYKVIVITNQSGVARGYYKEEDIENLHRYIDEVLTFKNTYIDAYYYCPHHPDGSVERYKIKCNCRKPSHGMIDQALVDFDIDLKQSVIVGDKEIDVQTGKNSGIGKCILVKSGHIVDEVNTFADSVYDSLYDFANDLKMQDKRF